MKHLLPAIICGILISLFLGSCENVQPSSTPISAETLAEHISAHVPESILCNDPVRVRFVREMIDETRVGQEVGAAILKFKPRIKGTSIWTDTRTIQFQAVDRFVPDAQYVLTIDSESLATQDTLLPEKLIFEFEVQPILMQVSVGPLRPDHITNGKQSLRGMVTTNVAVQTASVEKVLSVKYPVSQPEISWTHNKSGTVHTFSLSNIEKHVAPAQLKLSWDGTPILSRTTGAQIYTVPAYGEFEVTEVELFQNGTREIHIHFSETIDPSLNLAGLITLNSQSSGFKVDRAQNKLLIYPGKGITGSFQLTLSSALRDINNTQLSENYVGEFSFQDIAPQVALLGKGTIVPHAKEVIFPFKAINLNAVDVEIFEVFESNVLQFLQYNSLGSASGFQAVGRIVAQEKVLLKELASAPVKNTWQRYAIDLSNITTLRPGSIYEIRLGFQRNYSLYGCNESLVDHPVRKVSSDIESIWQYHYNYPGYEYSHIDDPCYPAFYHPGRFIRRNVLASNLGIIAKSGDGIMSVTINDLRTGRPVNGVAVAAFDFQQQLITTSHTNAQGQCDLTVKRPAAFLVADHGSEKGYLKTGDGLALMLSDFEVDGVKPQKGMKGFIYTEREVWRPGDTIFMNFILVDGTSKETVDHNVRCRLYNPRNQVRFDHNTSAHTGPIYNFMIPTDRRALTGNWRAQIEVGGATFQKSIQVETIQPNRLKIEFGPDEPIAGFNEFSKFDLKSRWLHGSPAAGLRAKVEMGLQPIRTTFARFSNYVFDDPARAITASVSTIFDAKLNNNGVAQIQYNHSQANSMPGQMLAQFKTRVFEPGGAFSTDQWSTPYNPFETYVGLSIPENKWGNKSLSHHQENNIPLVAVDAAGNPLANRQLTVGIYQAEWRWWWNRRNNEVAQFNSAKHLGAFRQDTIHTGADGRASVTYTPLDYGLYLIRVCDPESGHCSGDYAYSGYYGGDDNRNTAARLSFSTDKSAYAPGEEVTLQIPSAPGSTILISIEDHNSVLETHRVLADSDLTRFRFVTSDAMTPNVYAHVHLIQPHNHGTNDLPIRMYGVIPVSVEDPATHLQPVIEIPDVIRPEERFKITVSEEKGESMAYTIAIVDEGLLDLTSFETPDPWAHCYAREALSISTWDVYDHVLSGYGGPVERILTIGGDGSAPILQSPREANRFKPVVKHLGPYYLSPGELQTHEVLMPNYVGSVRAMVVAAMPGKYGHADKTVPVKNPVMVLATAPRVLAPGERIAVPVQVFAMDEAVGEVEVSIQTNGLLYVDGPEHATVSFERTGDQEVEFVVQSGAAPGVAEILIKASCNNDSASQRIELDIRNPNPFISEVEEQILMSGETWNYQLEDIGSPGTNEAVLEISAFLPVSLESRLRYLVRYPYGCLEQTTSAAFPQLYVHHLIELSPERKAAVDRNIRVAIGKLRNYLIPEGGLAYWPGNNRASEWGNSYAGHFLLEAKNAGHYVQPTLINSWKKYQKRKAENFREQKINGSYSGNTLMQAYRLYTLALAGEPALGPMNRLRLSKNIGNTATFMLAAAYAYSGQTQAAELLIANAEFKVRDYRESGYTYGSSTRDRAMLVEALLQMNKRQEASQLVRRIAEEFGRDRWFSTQAAAYGLIALSKFAGGSVQNGLQCKIELPGFPAQVINTTKSIYQVKIDLTQDDRNMALENMGEDQLFIRVITRGQPAEPPRERIEEHLKMQITYSDPAGNKLNPASLKRGTDFIATVQITNPHTLASRIDEMALQTIFPSGWEIINQRLDNLHKVQNSPFEYQDIQDDRVYTFFDMYDDQHTYQFKLNAAYEGRFILPAIYAEAMYDHAIQAQVPGMWVEVYKGSEPGTSASTAGN